VPTRGPIFVWRVRALAALRRLTLLVLGLALTVSLGAASLGGARLEPGGQAANAPIASPLRNWPPAARSAAPGPARLATTVVATMAAPTTWRWGDADNWAARARAGTLPSRMGAKRVHSAGRGSELGVDTAAAKPAVAPKVATVSAAPRWTGSYNLYRKTAFVTQRDFKWCVAASVQMMVNIVRHRSDRTAATQQRMITYAQASDNGPYGQGGGTDATGWIAALGHFGAGRYRAVGANTPGQALRVAAIAMLQTGRPVGMLVMEGRHAWVLHGFESPTDPRRYRHTKISAVRVSGPLYPIQQKNGYDLRPNTRLSVVSLARFFQPSSVGALVGKYVVIVPVH